MRRIDWAGKEIPPEDVAAFDAALQRLGSEVIVGEPPGMEYRWRPQWGLLVIGLIVGVILRSLF